MQDVSKSCCVFMHYNVRCGHRDLRPIMPLVAYDTTIVPEISVNSSSITRGNNYKLLKQTFTTIYGRFTEVFIYI